VGGDYTDPFFPDLSIGFWVVRLDYQTGQVLDNGSWRIAMPAFSCQLILSPRTAMTGIPDDNLLFSAALIRPTGCPNGSIFFTRVDSNLQLASGGAAAFSYSLANTEGITFAVNPSTGGIAFGAIDKGPTPSAYYSILDSNFNISAQRTVAISNASANPIFFFDGYDLSGAQAGLQSGHGSYQFIRADPAFTITGACIGTPASLLTPQPITCTPFGLQFTLNSANAITQNAFPVGENDFSIITEILCRQVSTCDSLQIHGDTSFCPGDQSAVFTALKSGTCLKQNTWQVDTTIFSILGQPNDTTIQLGFNREWTGYIYATIAGCGLKDSLPVTIHGQLPPVNLPPDTVLCPGTTILLQPQGSFRTYKWQDGSTGDVYQVKDTGLYYVSVTDFCGNPSSDTLRVRDCRKVLVFPNAFTPNQDGANDLFRPRVNGELKEFELAVYDRWGQSIFLTTDPAKGWNGSFNGKALPPGTFVWFCRYQFSNDSPRMQKGTVLLIR
jgi:gliding motility-associated-like protein